MDTPLLREPAAAQALPRRPWAVAPRAPAAGSSSELPEAEEAAAHKLIDFAKNDQWDELFRALGTRPELVDFRPKVRQYSILHQAIYYGRDRAVARLLDEYKADPAQCTRDNETCSELAEYWIDDAAQRARILSLVAAPTDTATVRVQAPAEAGTPATAGRIIFEWQQHQKSCFPWMDVNEETGYPIWKDELPTFARDDDVAAIAVSVHRKGIHEPIPLQCAVGPAVPIAFKASCFTWLMFIIIPWPILWRLTKCTSGKDQYEEHDIASYNTIVVICFAVPMLASFLWLEFLCLKYGIVSLIQTTGGFSILGKNVSFWVWCSFNMLVSLVSHTDLVTNGIFLALAIKMNSCQGYGHKLNCIWGHTIYQSVFGFLPHEPELNPYFHDLVFTFWCLMILQCLYGWVCSLPLPMVHKWIDRVGETLPPCTSCARKCLRSYIRCMDLNVDMADGDDWQPDYEARTEADAVEFIHGGPGHGTRYQTPMDRGEQGHSDHGTAWLALAETTRMCSITSMRLLYHRKKVEYYMEHPEGPNDGPTFGLLRRMLRTTTCRLVLFGIAQSGFQLNLQTTLLAMITLVGKMEESSDDADNSGSLGFYKGISVVNRQMLFGITIGLMNFGKGWYDTSCTWTWIRKAVQRWEAKDSTWSDKDKSIKILNSGLMKLEFALFLYVLIGIYTVVKLISIFLCHHCMFNATGCANIEHCCFNDADEMCWLRTT